MSMDYAVSYLKEGERQLERLSWREPRRAITRQVDLSICQTSYESTNVLDGRYTTLSYDGVWHVGPRHVGEHENSSRSDRHTFGGRISGN